MWLLAELFEELPEAGDLDKPKLVFFFDEAHLLFTDASKAFLERIEQTVKLIRSKGVGVFFCTQLPTDVPNAVLSQLGARVQHALRAFTPEDQAALAKTVKTYPNTKHYDIEEALTSLGTGEAIVTVLSERGAPTPVAWTRIRAPRSLMAAIGPSADVTAAAQASPLHGEVRHDGRPRVGLRAADGADRASRSPPRSRSTRRRPRAYEPEPPRRARGAGVLREGVRLAGGQVVPAVGRDAAGPRGHARDLRDAHAHHAAPAGAADAMIRGGAGHGSVATTDPPAPAAALQSAACPSPSGGDDDPRRRRGRSSTGWPASSARPTR